MTEYTCTSCNTAFSLAGVEGALHCPKCGAEVAERLPDSLEEVPGGKAPASAAPVASRPRKPRPDAKPVHRSSHLLHPPKGRPSQGRKVVPAVVAAAVVIGGAVWFFVLRDAGSKGARPGTTPSVPTATSTPGDSPAGGAGATPVAGAPNTASTPAGAPKSKADEFRARHAALDPGDLAGRRALMTFCRENELAEEQIVLREILLLDSDDEEARRRLGFVRHAAEGSPYAGRWLSKADAQLAAAYDRMLLQ